VGNHNKFGMMNPKEILRVQPLNKCLGLSLGEDVGETNGVNEGVSMDKNLDFGHQR
jgi:hypothetical protein